VCESAKLPTFFVKTNNEIIRSEGEIVRDLDRRSPFLKKRPQKPLWSPRPQKSIQSGARTSIHGGAYGSKDRAQCYERVVKAQKEKRTSFSAMRKKEFMRETEMAVVAFCRRWFPTSSPHGLRPSPKNPIPAISVSS
jgi:hypothetical protein